MAASITKNSFTEETHPWDSHIPETADKLLIGTFPTEEKNRKQSFFYCSGRNRFWDVLANVAATELCPLSSESAIKERKDILQTLKLGLTDMGKIILRQRKSSNDHSLFPIEFMDITQLLYSNPNIHTLIVSGNLQGNSSLSWFGTYCSLNKVDIDLKEIDKAKRTKVRIADREVAILLGYSGSGISRKKTQELIESYKNILQ